MVYDKVDKSHIVIEGKKPRHIFGMDSIDFNHIVSPVRIGLPKPKSYFEIKCRFHGLIPKQTLNKALKEGNTNISGDIHDSEKGIRVKFHDTVMTNLQINAGYMGNIVTEITVMAEEIYVYKDDENEPEKVMLS